MRGLWRPPRRRVSLRLGPAWMEAEPGNEGRESQWCLCLKPNLLSNFSDTGAHTFDFFAYGSLSLISATCNQKDPNKKFLMAFLSSDPVLLRDAWSMSFRNCFGVDIPLPRPCAHRVGQGLGMPTPAPWRLPAWRALPEHRDEFSELHTSARCLHCTALPSGCGGCLAMPPLTLHRGTTISARLCHLEECPSHHKCPISISDTDN